MVGALKCKNLLFQEENKRDIYFRFLIIVIYSSIIIIIKDYLGTNGTVEENLIYQKRRMSNENAFSKDKQSILNDTLFIPSLIFLKIKQSGAK